VPGKAAIEMKSKVFDMVFLKFTIAIQMAHLLECLLLLVADDSVPGTPNTPLGYAATSPFTQQHQLQTEHTNSSGTSAGVLAAAIGGAPLALPLARSDKHVILSTTNPTRPRVSSMHTKLDHTKIDTSLYQKVRHSAV
jgi:hypothetical protein